MIATILGFIRSILALLFWIVFAPPAALIAFPWTLITGKVGFLYWIGMGMALMGAKIAGAKVKLVGLEKIDRAGTYIFMSNHVSNAAADSAHSRADIRAGQKSNLAYSHPKYGAEPGRDCSGGP
jgi:hypothetical protein